MKIKGFESSIVLRRLSKQQHHSSSLTSTKDARCRSPRLQASAGRSPIGIGWSYSASGMVCSSRVGKRFESECTASVLLYECLYPVSFPTTVYR